MQIHRLNSLMLLDLKRGISLENTFFQKMFMLQCFPNCTFTKRSLELCYGGCFVVFLWFFFMFFFVVLFLL